MSRIHLEHALLDVTNLDRTLPFYRALLPDWQIRWEGKGMDGDRWVHFGPPGEGQPGYLSLYETPGLTRKGDDGLRIEHVGFAHSDLEELVRRVASLGLEPSDRVEDDRYRRAYFTDPDGHELEFVQKMG